VPVHFLEIVTLMSSFAMADEPTSPKPSSGDNNVRVMVRVRPFNSREMAISEKKGERLQSCIKMRDKTCAVVEYGVDEKGFPTEKEREAFQFDECFWSLPVDQGVSSAPFADQKIVYEQSGLLALQAGMDGYNVCIFAYGQTGSGKTHSMLGTETDPGISLRMTDDLFARIEQMKSTVVTTKVVVECMFFEIYNEKVRDLFNKKAKAGDEHTPKIRQHPTKGVFVEGLLRKEVTEAKTTKHLIDRGTKERAAAETKMNAHSSRSHAIFLLQITQNDAMKGTQRVSSINLVDLAGSEKIKMSQVTGQALTEAKNINQSLSTLRRVIDVLIDNAGKSKKNQSLPPFRDSVLTYVLSDSLGGNSKTMMVATVSPHDSNIEDTIGTLRYALRAKAIVCDPTVNEEKSAAMMDSMKDEILALQMKLRQGGGAGGRAAANAEILKEIELREQEVKKMEEEQKDMEGRLASAENMAAVAEQRLKEADVVKAELDFSLVQQKRERFASAFRNAFIITTEKKKQETSKVEMELLARENIDLKRNNAFLETELRGARIGLEELQRTTDAQIAEFTAGTAQRDQMIVQLKRQVANQQQENTYLQTQLDTLLSKHQSTESAKLDLERRIQRLQEELLATSAMVEREKADKAKQQQQFEDKVKHLNEDIDNLRKRKDKYKQQYMESSAKASAHKTIIDNMQSDRGAYLTTLQAQQQVVAEQATTAARLVQDKRESENKSTALEKRLESQQSEAQNLAEALREYQAASAEWMYENHAVSRELERVQRSYNDLRAVSADPTYNNSAHYSPTSSVHGSPRPARPSATRAVHHDPVAARHSTPRASSYAPSY
jgi:hypothetical protein